MAKADGGELVARVMRENRVSYCFAINGGHLFPILAQLAQPRNQADPYAPRAGHRLCRRRLCAHDRRSRRVHGHGRMRPDQRRDRTVPRRDDQQRGGLRLGTASEYRGPLGLVPGSLRLGRLQQLRQVHQARHSTGARSNSICGWLSARRSRRRKAWRCSRFRRTSSITRTTKQAAQGGQRFTIRRRPLGRRPAKIDRALEMLSAAERPLIAGGDGLFWSQAGPSCTSSSS